HVRRKRSQRCRRNRHPHQGRQWHYCLVDSHPLATAGKQELSSRPQQSEAEGPALSLSCTNAGFPQTNAISAALAAGKSTVNKPSLPAMFFRCAPRHSPCALTVAPPSITPEAASRLGPESISTVALFAFCPGSTTSRSPASALLFSNTVFSPECVFSEYATTASSGCCSLNVFFTSCPAPASANSSIP